MAIITSIDELLRGETLRGEAVTMRAFRGPATVSPSTDEVLYLLDRDEGILVPAGAEVRIEAGTVLAVSVEDSGPPLSGQPGAAVLHVRMADAPIQRTGDRWYRELIQSEITQFVGSIPPGRAPDHFHLYEEVLCILQGAGVVHADGRETKVGKGSCVYLPKRNVHCLENTGSGELRLVGVFYPAGSPAVRYGVDQSADSSPAGR